MCHQTTERLPSQAASVQTARHLVAATLHAWGVTADDAAYSRVHDAILVTSELVANAVRFCTHDIELTLVTHRDRIEIDVTDDNLHPAELREPQPLTVGGR